MWIDGAWIEQTILYRKNGKKPWVFSWNDTLDGYVHEGRKHTYKIFIDKKGKHLRVWIGSSLELPDETVWFTVENELNADYFELGNVRITFTRTPGGHLPIMINEIMEEGENEHIGNQRGISER